MRSISGVTSVYKPQMHSGKTVAALNSKIGAQKASTVRVEPSIEDSFEQSIQDSIKQSIDDSIKQSIAESIKQSEMAEMQSVDDRFRDETLNSVLDDNSLYSEPSEQTRIDNALYFDGMNLGLQPGETSYSITTCNGMY